MPDAVAWKSRSIYQVLTDRFAVTGGGNGGPDIDYLSRQYCGGTWQGIISKLDYIQGMGFDAIWISPVTKNIEDNTHYGTAYHGYWQEDLYSVNPHFGTADDLLALSDALHARGMYLMVDVVVNHMASETPNVNFSRYTPFNDSSFFHEESYISNYDDPKQCEEGWLGDQNVPLPDLDTENPTVANTLHAWISSLIQKFRIDGIRIDTVKHVPKDFWPGFVRAAGVWAVGEVLSGDPNYLSSYQPFLGGLLDYATYYPLKRAFKGDGSASMYEVTNLLQDEYRQKWGDMQQLATFMENHDMPRFTRDTTSDIEKVKNALAWTFLTDGIPILYYGQEQSFSGRSANQDDDQDARQLMWSSGYAVTPLYQYISLLNRVRKLCWNNGYSGNLTSLIHAQVDVSVTQKGPLLMLLTNGGSNADEIEISTETSFPAGTVVVDVLTNEALTIKSSATDFTLIAGQPRIYIPYALATQICSEIIPPTTSTLDTILSFFCLSSEPEEQDTEMTSFNSGIPAHNMDILRPPMRDISMGQILQPSDENRAGPYSIFGVSARNKPMMGSGGGGGDPQMAQPPPLPQGHPGHQYPPGQYGQPQQWGPPPGQQAPYTQVY